MLLCLCLATAAAADEQRIASSFAELPKYIDLGDIVFVVDETGQEIKARVEQLAPAQIHLTRDGGPLVLSEEKVRRIEVQDNDRILNGVLIGAAIGGGLAVVAMSAVYGWDSSETAEIALVYLGIGAGTGAGIDALKKGRKLVYSRAADKPGTRISVYPILTRDRKGVAVTVSF
jgi:hypothetical protein